MGRLFRAPGAWLALPLVAACGPGAAGRDAYQEYDCPAPIGRIVREDCSRSALQYAGTSFEGSAGVSGVSATATYKEHAIREADALVSMLKEQRVALCNNFNTCKLSVAEYRDEQKTLDDSFVALLALKDKLAMMDAASATKLLGEIQSIRSGARRGRGGPPEGPAQATSPAGVPQGDYELRSKATAKCLDVPYGKPDSGVQLQIWDCNGSDAQRWRITPQPDGSVTLTAKASGKCVDVPYQKPDPGLRLQQWDCNGTVAQAWLLHREDDGSFSLNVRATGLCLDVNRGDPASGTAVIQYGCHGGDNQRWLLTAK